MYIKWNWCSCYFSASKAFPHLKTHYISSGNDFTAKNAMSSNPQFTANLAIILIQQLKFIETIWISRRSSFQMRSLCSNNWTTNGNIIFLLKIESEKCKIILKLRIKYDKINKVPQTSSKLVIFYYRLQHVIVCLLGNSIDLVTFNGLKY